MLSFYEYLTIDNYLPCSTDPVHSSGDYSRMLGRGLEVVAGCYVSMNILP